MRLFLGNTHLYANTAVAVRSACLLELSRILVLEVDTDDKTDPSCQCVAVHP